MRCGGLANEWIQASTRLLRTSYVCLARLTDWTCVYTLPYPPSYWSNNKTISITQENNDNNNERGKNSQSQHRMARLTVVVITIAQSALRASVLFGRRFLWCRPWPHHTGPACLRAFDSTLIFHKRLLPPSSDLLHHTLISHRRILARELSWQAHPATVIRLSAFLISCCFFPVI